MDRHARQRGLVAQDLVADADITLYGTGRALPYLLQCLTLVGAARRHGRLLLRVPDGRLVTAADLQCQFLLQPDDLGLPLGDALAYRAGRLDEAVTIVVMEGLAGRGPAVPRGLALAVPGTSEVPWITCAARGDGAVIRAWGQPLRTCAYLGPQPPVLATGRLATGRLASEPSSGDGHAAGPAPGLLTAALAAVCGGMLAQVALGQLGALISGPSVLTSWLEEQLWVSQPGIGAWARAVISDGVPWPALHGVLERMQEAGQLPPGAAERFGVLVGGRPAEPLVTTVVDDDAVVVTVRREEPPADPAVVRPLRADPPPVQAMLWSPVEGPRLDGDQVTGDDLAMPAALPPATIVACGAGALGSWACGVLAASRIPGLALLVVDMDDAVEEHNLNRQVLFAATDIGLPKAPRAARRLAAIDPGLAVAALQVMIAPEVIDELTPGAGGRGGDDGAGGDDGPDGFEVVDAELRRERAGYQAALEELAGTLQAADAIVSCPDNHQTRWALNVIAERLGIPLVNGAVDGFTGRVHVCDPGDSGQCLVCWLGESIADDPARLSCTDRVGAAPVAAIVTSAAVVGAAEAAALIAHLAGLGKAVRRYHVFEGSQGLLAGYRGADRDPGECPRHLAGRP